MTRKEFDKGYKLLVHWCKENDIWIRIKNDLFIKQNRTLDRFFANMNGCNTYNGYANVCDWLNFTEFKSTVGSISEDDDELRWLIDNFIFKWRKWANDHADLFK